MSYSDGPITEVYSKQLSKSYTPNPKEKALSDYVSKQFEIGEHSKGKVIEDSWNGLAFFIGEHWSRFNRVSQVLSTENTPLWRVRMVLNYILPTVETFVGKVTENRPGFMCMPATADDDDIEAARQCDKLLDYMWSELDMLIKIRELAKWVACTPAGFIKSWWDPTKGEEYVSEVPTGGGLDEYDSPIMKTEKRKMGAPAVEILSPLEVVWDPGAKNMDTCHWIMHVNYLHIDHIRERWPKKGKAVNPTSVMQADEFSRQIIKEVRGTSGDQAIDLDRVSVIEYFEKASPRYPKGLYCLMAGGIILEQGDLAYNELPFQMVRHNTVPGRFVGEGLVRPLIPAQKELNKSVSQRVENKNLHAQPKWRAEKGSVEKGSITDEPGEIIFYNRSAQRPPEPLPPTPLSPEHRLIEAEQRAHIEAISGISEYSRGMSGGGISGRAIGLLADLDQTKLGPTVREFESAIEKLCDRLLRLWRDNMPVSRTISVIGRNTGLEVFEFHTRSVKDTRVRVVANSMLPRHPSYRREQVMQMFQLGVLGDPADPKTKMLARKMLEFGDIDKIHGDRDRDRNYAREENHTMARGQWVDVQSWEDHVTHIDEHLGFMKSMDFRLLSKEEQDSFQKHLAWHYWRESQNQQGVPFWQEHAATGEQGWPPAGPEAPPQAPEQPMAAPPMDAFGPEPPMMGPEGPPMAGPEQMPGLAPGMGGSPELNQAVGTRGPGVADYESGFELQ